jgi:lysozyme
VSRQIIAALALSATALIGIAVHESYTDNAVIPIKGDVPTKGFGTTTNPDGSPVRMGDKTTPVRALIDLQRDLTVFEAAVKRCASVPMFQYEYDAWVSFTYNVGSNAFCKSTAAKKLNAGDYTGACNEMLRWNQVQGRVVRGLTNRRAAEREMCLKGVK